MKKTVLLLAVLLPGIASAEGVALVGKFGTLGFGAELVGRLGERWNGRLGVNAYDYSMSSTESDIAYDFKLKLRTVSLLADYHTSPDGSFRLSFGLMNNGNKASLTARPTAGSYVINGISYDTTQVSSLTGEMSFRSTAPYFGVGWGNAVAPGRGWNINVDLGALYQNRPRVALNVVCGSTLSAPDCSTLQNHVAAEQAEAEVSVNSFRWWPVVSVGASYQF